MQNWSMKKYNEILESISLYIKEALVEQWRFHEAVVPNGLNYWLAIDDEYFGTVNLCQLPV